MIINKEIYYTEMEINNFSFYVAATERGGCFVGSSPKDFNELKKWVDETFGENTQLIQNETFLDEYKTQLSQYFEGKRKQFSLPLDMAGTDFQKAVWKELLTIPYGEVTSYGDIAKQMGRTLTSSRAVGKAIGKNPLMIFVPCHRVLAKDKKLTGFRGGIQMKKDLLELEQISVK